MSRIQRSEVLDYVTYSEQRDAIQDKVFPIKRARRVHVGEYLTFLFENHDTILYQIHEMIRAERIIKESHVQHEIDAYSALLGGRGELGCTLLIEIPDPERRAVLLRQWLELPHHVYVRLEDGAWVRAAFDPAQVGEDRLSSVQYLRFDTRGVPPVAVGCDLPELQAETALTAEQRAALAADLAE